MAATQPERKFLPVPFTGVWDESRTPIGVGASSLAACANLSYRRYGSWGKRSGSKLAYSGSVDGSGVGPFTSGIRWCRAFPVPQTTLVVAQRGALYLGADPNTTTPTNLVQYAGYDLPTAMSLTQPVRFAAVRDNVTSAPDTPSTTVGSDVLVMTGLTGYFDYQRGLITITGTVVANQVFSIAVSKGTTTISGTYTALATDNCSSVAAALARAFNAKNLPPYFIAPAVVMTGTNTSATIALATQQSHNGGSVIIPGFWTYGITLSGPAGATATPLTASFTGGQAIVTAPIKFDGFNVSGLSPYITQPFTGVVNWHNHLWFWGDPANPDSLYATDINQPEGFTFMIQNGPYFIGQGDGDPGIRAVVPMGNLLYIFKSHSVWTVSGYDFQSGEYAFSVTPALTQYGTPAQECVAVLRNALVFWTGRKFARLAVGSYEPEVIGAPIPMTSGLVAGGKQNLMRAAAGSFIALTGLTGAVDPPIVPVPANEVLQDQAYFACDVGSGAADTVLVYDDAATVILGQYAWSKWTGLNVGGWIPFVGNVPSSAGPATTDPPALFFLLPATAAGPRVVQYGADPYNDSNAPIPWLAQTGWFNFGTPALMKELHRVFVEFIGTHGMAFTLKIITQQIGTDRTFTFPSVGGGDFTDQYLLQKTAINPFLRAYAFVFQLSEAGLGSASYEFVSMVLDFLESPFLP